MYEAFTGWLRNLQTRKLESIKFFLFTATNPDTGQELVEGDIVSLKKSNFNASHPTKVSVHGWEGKWNSSENMLMKEAFLKNGRNDSVNIILVDWSVYSESINYYTVKSKCSVVGAVLGDLLDWMNTEAGLKFSTLTLIGHSLGAHVAGFAGKTVIKGRIQSICGLDPAMPLFYVDNPKTRLASTDAIYVETIQTNGGLKGFYSPIGKASFYPNGGRSQPGCGFDLDGVCAHYRAVEYYAEAVRLGTGNKFISHKCPNLEALREDNCNLPVNGVRMGYPSNNEKADGIYFLKTNSQSPYGMGL